MGEAKRRIQSNYPMNATRVQIHDPNISVEITGSNDDECFNVVIHNRDIIENKMHATVYLDLLAQTQEVWTQWSQGVVRYAHADKYFERQRVQTSSGFEITSPSVPMGFTIDDMSSWPTFGVRLGYAECLLSEAAYADFMGKLQGAYLQWVRNGIPLLLKMLTGNV
jgi:hypothetical protein